VIFTKLIPAGVLAVVCSATPLFAQAQTPMPVQPPTIAQPTPTPVAMPTTTSPQPPSAQAPATDTDHGTVIALLDRIQKVLDTAVDDQKAKGGSVSIDRGLIDEMRAEVTQVKVTLQGEKK
jgi:hypothetical protein